MAYPAARCSLPSICLASAELKKCLHLTSSPHSLHTTTYGGGEEDVVGGLNGEDGEGGEGKERDIIARREEEALEMVGVNLKEVDVVTVRG